jgi:hypothetical protein
MVRPVERSPGGEAPEGNRRRRDRHRRGDRGERGERAERDPNRAPAPVEATGALTADAERISGPESARESSRAAADAAAPELDLAPQSGATQPHRDEARVPREQERIAESEQQPVESQHIAPALRSEAPVQPAQPQEQQRPAEAARPARPVVDVPPITSTLPPDSGLEIVETRFKPTPEPEPEPVPAGPRRVRPPRVEVTEEPLQIVETRKSEQPRAG